MKKLEFAGQVLLYVTVIPVLFVGTLKADDARIKARENNRPMYRSYTNAYRTHVQRDPRVARLIISCRPPMVVKK